MSDAWPCMKMARKYYQLFLTHLLKKGWNSTLFFFCLVKEYFKDTLLSLYMLFLLLLKWEKLSCNRRSKTRKMNQRKNCRRILYNKNLTNKTKRKRMRIPKWKQFYPLVEFQQEFRDVERMPLSLTLNKS